MPAESKKQQRFFGLVKAIQEGKATGSGKAQEAADSMSEQSVRDYAATSHEDLPESKKESMDPNTAKLLKTVGASAAVGLGGVGVYGLLKYLHDNSLLGDSGQAARVKAMQKRLAIPSGRKAKERIEREETPVDPSNFLPDMGAPALSELPQDLAEDMRNPDKQASLEEYLGDPFMYGMAAPVAMVAPAMTTFILGKRLIDQHRKKKLNQDVERAKKEFEAALSKTSSSDIQSELDSLYQSVKAGADSYVPPKAKSFTPAPSDTPAAPMSTEYGPGFGPQGLAYALGLAPGVGALLGWMYMSHKMKDDPERRKLKEMNTLLKRDIASGALSSGLDLEETEEGKPKFRL